MYVCVYVCVRIEHEKEERGKEKGEKKKRIYLLYTKLLLHCTIRLLDLGNIVFLSILKCARGDLVQPQQALIWVLDKNVFAVLHAADHVDDRAHYSPAISQVKVHLFGKFAGVVANYAEDDVAVVGLWIGARDEAEERVGVNYFCLLGDREK